MILCRAASTLRQQVPTLIAVRCKFTLNPDDLEFNAMVGWGAGGQAVQKNHNCAQFIHKPTGIVVKNHSSRSLNQNKREALKSLTDKVELHLYGEESSVHKKKAVSEAKNKNKKRLKKNKAALKKKLWDASAPLITKSENVDNSLEHELSDNDNVDNK